MVVEEFPVLTEVVVGNGGGMPPLEEGDVLRFGEDITLADFGISFSADRQYLLIYCRRKLVAFCSSIGGDIQRFELADGTRYSLAELLNQLPAGQPAA